MKYALPVLSTLFLVYGAVYSMVYYAQFGISVQFYFDLQDYVRANIDNLATFVVPLVLLYILKAFSGGPGPTSAEERQKHQYKVDTEAGFLAAMIAGNAVVWAATGKSHLAVASLAGVVGLAWLRFNWNVLPKLLVKTLTDKSVLLAIVVLDIVPVTLGWNAIQALMRADSVRYGALRRTACIQFTDDAAPPLTDAPSDSLVVAGMSTNYCFIYERGASRTYVVPRQYVKCISLGN